MSASTLYLPTLKKEIARPWFLPSPESVAEAKRIAAGQFFLIRNSGVLGERLRCDPAKGGCNQKHDFLTLRCVPQPWSGLTGGLYAYFRAVGDNGLAGYLSPAERSRYDGIVDALGTMPDLASRHPQLARSLGVRPSDATLGAYALGVLEQIPVTLARRYRDRINARGIRPRFTLEGLEAA